MRENRFFVKCRGEQRLPGHRRHRVKTGEPQAPSRDHRCPYRTNGCIALRLHRTALVAWNNWISPRSFDQTVSNAGRASSRVTNESLPNQVFYEEQFCEAACTVLLCANQASPLSPTRADQREGRGGKCGQITPTTRTVWGQGRRPAVDHHTGFTRATGAVRVGRHYWCGVCALQ